MEIFFFHRKTVEGVISIQENFSPLIAELEKNNNVKVFSVPYYGANPIHMLRNILYIRKNCSKNGINHITGDIHYGMLGLIGKKSVLTIHDDYTMREARGFLDRLIKKFLWFYLPIKISNATVCTNPYVLEGIKKIVNSKKLLVITHQVAPFFKRKGDGKINKDCPTFLQVGTAANKNLETTLKALCGLKCKLVVLKKMTEAQKQMANSLGIDYINKWDLPYNDVLKEYENSDIVLFPSLYEGLGVPVFEAQAARKVVITSNRTPMNWVAGTGAMLLDNPLDVDEYRNAIHSIINNDELRDSLLCKGDKNVKRFSLKTAVSNYTNLYNRILSNAK